MIIEKHRITGIFFQQGWKTLKVSAYAIKVLLALEGMNPSSKLCLEMYLFVCMLTRNFETPSRHKSEDEVGRKRQRERFSEEQVAAMTQLAERAGWSITAISWEERVKFCEEYAVTKVGWTPSVTSLIL